MKSTRSAAYRFLYKYCLAVLINANKKKKKNNLDWLNGNPFRFKNGYTLDLITSFNVPESNIEGWSEGKSIPMIEDSATVIRCNFIDFSRQCSLSINYENVHRIFNGFAQWGRVFCVRIDDAIKKFKNRILHFIKPSKRSKIERSGKTRDFSKFSNDTKKKKKIIKFEKENFFVASRWEIYRNEAYLKF